MIQGSPIDRDQNPLAYDLLTMLCCILEETGPVEITEEQQVKALHDGLDIKSIPNKAAIIVSYTPRPALLEMEGDSD